MKNLYFESRTCVQNKKCGTAFDQQYPCLRIKELKFLLWSFTGLQKNMQRFFQSYICNLGAINDH